MQIFYALSELPPDFGPTVATIGNFDGVHRGHQWVIGEVIARARALKARSLAITFDPHPARILRPQTALPLITPLAQKLSLLRDTGVDATLVLPFTAELSHTSARDFATQTLHDKLNIIELHEGENFRFGYQAEAGVESLDALGHELGFHVSVYTPRATHGVAVSSSTIRQLVAQGNVSRARALLGRPFAIHSTPASGRGYGTRYTVPTINLAPYSELIPAIGVYITTLDVNGETFDAVTNVGNRPTFGEDSFTIESHLLNFHPIALDESTPLTLSFLHRLRDEIRWPSPEALREQIGRDVRKAQRYFHLCRQLG
ncbi:MAG: bifunctional riboflavin kinase/FAD synthetase [Edaphobacter sp.]|uniref:bifunctional riboflavin kinase/FAD synthetase n=1 Tax=Edaphobacter sp. TaxID=1934404 RepID=UPI0023A50B11|nr:bifunctional riboflavin kinase/FAD synthetase [Edaphobacter sp.]MDE1177830.1 bifunctional riboflavin kinase/FAD synthetase [Edaphobacter sp.]